MSSNPETFGQAWEFLESKGLVDHAGSKEYMRICEEWELSGGAVAFMRFILEQSNFIPVDEGHGFTVPQLMQGPARLIVRAYVENVENESKIVDYSNVPPPLPDNLFTTWWNQVGNPELHRLPDAKALDPLVLRWIKSIAKDAWVESRQRTLDHEITPQRKEQL